MHLPQKVREEAFAFRIVRSSGEVGNERNLRRSKGACVCTGSFHFDPLASRLRPLVHADRSLLILFLLPFPAVAPPYRAT